MTSLFGTHDFDLRISRFIAAPPEAVWTAMTRDLAQWWCPLPWRVEIEAMDWRPGGRSEMVMLGPDGERMPHNGIILDVQPGRYWVSTDAFSAGWKPADAFMVGIWSIEPEGDGTRYTAIARHWTAEARHRHAEMGFEAGWGECANQLKRLCETGSILPTMD